LLETSKTYQCLLGNNLEDVTMDNQQPSISGFEFGWFCGIIDGEGCIGLWSRGRKDGPDYRPGLRMTNTSKDIIDAFTSVLDRLEVGYHLTYCKPRKETQKEHWTVVIEGFKRLSKLLPIIKNSLVCKNKQAQLVAEWVDSRSQKWHRAAYDERELEIPKLVSALNFRGLQK
jgi:hypothetical protein